MFSVTSKRMFVYGILLLSHGQYVLAAGLTTDEKALFVVTGNYEATVSIDSSDSTM